ncbi:hypothetical protein ID1000_05350 [Helicobacter pylori]
MINEGLRNSLDTHIIAVAFLRYSGVEVIQDALIDSLEEKLLPGTIPSIKAMIVEFISACEEKGVEQVALQDIYQALEERIKKEEWGYKYKSDTFRNTIRGDLNHHVLKDNPLKDNLGLFERPEKGFYVLTPKWHLYKGR